MRRSILLCAAAWVAASVVAVPGVGNAGGPGRRAVTAPRQVRAIVGGEMVTTGVAHPPPEADLRSMTLARGPAGAGYIGTLTFAAPEWRRLITMDGQRATHQVFISLQPPEGARMRVHLNPDGVATIDRASGDAFARIGDAVARSEGPSVIFEIPESVGMTPDWEVQGHALVRSRTGAGVHAHTAQVRVGSLTGEDGAVVRLPLLGTNVDRAGVPLLWEPRAVMPTGSRPTSMRVMRRGDRLAFEITLDAPPTQSQIDGADAVDQVVILAIGEPGPGQYTVFFDPIHDRVFGNQGGRTGQLDRDMVEVRASTVTFILDEVAKGEALGTLGDAVPVADLAQSEPPSAPPSPAELPDAPPPPVIALDTDVAVVGIVTAQGGESVAIESPVVPVGELIPPPVSGGFPTLPLVGGAALMLIIGGLIFRFLVRGPAAEDVPPPFEDVPPPVIEGP